MTGFAEKMDKLIFYDQILLEDSRYIGITEDEIDGYIAYKIQRFMNKYVINPKIFIYYNATENEIRERMKAFMPDITDEHITHILEKYNMALSTRKASYIIWTRCQRGMWL